MYKGLYDTREGLSKHDAAIVGNMTAELISAWGRWMHRRVERVTFCDEDAVRRTVSVDFTLPRWFHRYRDTQPGELKRQLVPLGFLRKGVLANFSLQNESGASVPLLTAPQNAQVAEAVLWALAKEVLKTGGFSKKVRNRIKCDIRALVRASTDKAEETFFRLFHSNDTASRARQALVNDPAFPNTARLFVGHFLALTMLDIGIHERRVLHFSYEETVWNGERSGWLNTTKRAIRLAAGQPRVVTVGMPSASEAESTHLEVEAPDGLMITARESYYQLEDGTSVERQYVEASLSRAHFHFAHVLPQALVNVSMYLRPRRSTIVRGAFLSSLLAFAATATVTCRLPTPNEGNETATTLLLAATGLLGLVVVRSGEDKMATSLLFPLRMLAIMPTALAVVAALVVVAHPGELLSRLSLGIISLLVAFSAALLGRNWYLVRRQQET